MPTDGLPTYRLLTGHDDDEFCRRVSESLRLGYRLYGDAMMSSVDGRVIVGQAVVWSSVPTDAIEG